MAFLPIAGRELRVASRKLSTFWVRLSFALVALLIGVGFLLVSLVGTLGVGPATLGRALFATLSWISLAGALIAGLFFTADCLCEEKREGTLGLLFLTDLRGYDIVIGKLLATSLRGFYGLLAVFPILAVPLLMGGVTGLQFWKTSLALINALFISMVAGLIVSAISRDFQKALAGTLLLLVLWVAVGPMVDGWLSDLNGTSFNPILSLSSPGYLFVVAGGWGQPTFWSGLFVNQALAWTFLILTCLILPRVWQDKANKTLAPGTWTHWWKFGGTKRRKALRRQLIDPVNPITWLACRERWQAKVMWGISLLVAGGFILVLINASSTQVWMLGTYVGGLISMVLYLGVASQVGRFFVEIKRSGLMEMLLTTPLTVRQILQGFWRALIRLYGFPLVLLMVLLLLNAYLAQRQTWNAIATTTAPTAATPVATTNTPGSTNTVVVNTPVTVTTTGAGLAAAGVTVPVVMGLMGLLTFAGNMVAVAWFGMWMGLTSRNGSLSALKTILYVQVIPWFAINFVSAMLVPLLVFRWTMGGFSNKMIMWYPLIMALMSAVLYLIKNVVLSLWARKRLYASFRMQASEGRSFPLKVLVPPVQAVPANKSEETTAVDETRK